MASPELLAAAKAVDEALRPVKGPMVRKENPLRPAPVPALRRAPGEAKEGKAMAARAEMPVRSRATPPRRDNSRALPTAVHGDAILVTMPPMARGSVDQQKAAAERAAAVLADAQKAAPGFAVHVQMRGRIVASTDAAQVVSVAPPRAGKHAAHHPAAPPVLVPGKPRKPA